MDEKKIRAQDKWDMKAGVSCKELHLSQGPELTKLMQQFIEENR